MLEELRKEFVDLGEPPDGAAPAWFRERGRRLERIIHGLLRAEGLEPRTSFRPKGEEVDGSFDFMGRTYLFEAKWHADALPASQLYAFKGKVDGKLLGTVGVFIAINGFSEDAADALRAGKTPNVLMFDGDDFRAALLTDAGFAGVLKTKLRKAAETGEVYFPYSSTEVEPASPEHQGRTIERDRATDEIIAGPERVLVVEGELDRLLVIELGSRIVHHQARGRRFSVVVAHGKLGLTNLVNGFLRGGNDPRRFVVLADGEGHGDIVLSGLKHEIESDEVTVIVAEPSLLRWVLPDVDEDQVGTVLREGAKSLRNFAARVEIDDLEQRDETFRQFAEMLRG